MSDTWSYLKELCKKQTIIHTILKQSHEKHQGSQMRVPEKTDDLNTVETEWISTGKLGDDHFLMVHCCRAPWTQD